MQVPQLPLDHPVEPVVSVRHRFPARKLRALQTLLQPVPVLRLPVLTERPVQHLRHVVAYIVAVLRRLVLVGRRTDQTPRRVVRSFVRLTYSDGYFFNNL